MKIFVPTQAGLTRPILNYLKIEYYMLGYIPVFLSQKNSEKWKLSRVHTSCCFHLNLSRCLNVQFILPCCMLLEPKPKPLLELEPKQDMDVHTRCCLNFNLNLNLCRCLNDIDATSVHTRCCLNLHFNLSKAPHVVKEKVEKSSTFFHVASLVGWGVGKFSVRMRVAFVH